VVIKRGIAKLLSVFSKMANSFDVVFCGNPGVGKSTLLSCISGIQFKSGLSFGSGMTERLQFQSNPNSSLDVRFADTPGLSDIKVRELAAKQITNALRDGANNGRRLLLVFVLTLEAGRVKPDDIVTLEKVMESIEAPGYDLTRNSFGIIVNKCSFLKKPTKAREGINTIRTQFATDLSKYKTNYIEFLKVYDELEDEENATTNIDGLMEFLLGLKGIDVKVAKNIDVSNLEQVKEKMELEWRRKLEQIAEANEEQRAKWEEEKEEMRRDMQTKMRAAARERESHEAIQNELRGVKDALDAVKQNAERSEVEVALLRQQLSSRSESSGSGGCTIL